MHMMHVQAPCAQHMLCPMHLLCLLSFLCQGRAYVFPDQEQLEIAVQACGAPMGLAMHKYSCACTRCDMHTAVRAVYPDPMYTVL